MMHKKHIKFTVNSGTGVLTLNRGYRGATATGITVYKGTVNEIPVGYVAFDVQKSNQMLHKTMEHIMQEQHLTQDHQLLMLARHITLH